ncbi:MAG: hypothetical protein A2W61_08025 [Deltaproteobacteria bacterium RIFCSPLOWO2_01_44_7]|nr:MAG: hypothetical protein A2712_10405 [Deltaproteobacteria bacterium RIFCSPHIGHO2_01_FULL_43_49]OGQ15518.1 MAG: hypothetical protein A3D22_10935 [Deltaproteobacteria bacterium RIFCSPHIGHO2_02_FULL_44_53]OGQ28460.1 MAG: hypothetical protein A3D98_03120 [Deltaproteobacteria bacterium RIFCSPHIGHO2_12_FULL_44_21]OGQ32324.1 MAG: hypothetical protein A2979_00780 [Deltaproteobacteria bacterium RIFCSPLOWO2_01_FULL_45_74]OGQ37686.1 MAG: hypothetical protein A2W61_08025 [Deltaproteobacteria bacterium 
MDTITKIVILFLFFVCSGNLYANPPKGLELLSTFPQGWIGVEKIKGEFVVFEPCNHDAPSINIGKKGNQYTFAKSDGWGVFIDHIVSIHQKDGSNFTLTIKTGGFGEIVKEEASFLDKDKKIASWRRVYPKSGITEKLDYFIPKQYEKELKHVKEDPKACPES